MVISGATRLILCRFRDIIGRIRVLNSSSRRPARDRAEISTIFYLPCSPPITQVLSHRRQGRDYCPCFFPPPQVDSVYRVKTLPKRTLCQTVKTDCARPRGKNCLPRKRKLHTTVLPTTSPCPTCWQQNSILNMPLRFPG